VAVREAVREVLQRHGYTVLEATNGAEALQLSAGRSQPIHLLLTDVVMPEISGPEAAERMARQRPGLKVLYMSGYTDDALGSHGVLHAGTALLQKPFSMADLTRRVRDLLDAPADPPA
jgi:hypothetical protein